MDKYNSEWLKIEEWIKDKIRRADIAEEPDSKNYDALLKEPSLNYQVLLEEASRNMIRVRRPETLIKMIIKTVDQLVRTEHTSMLVYSAKKHSYLLVDSKGIVGHKIPMGFLRITSSDPLIRFFEKKINYKINYSGVISYNELVAVRNNEPSTVNDKYLVTIDKVISQLKLLKTEICVPIYYKKFLKGIFLFGRKLSDADFSGHEISFFSTLANDVGMALANAELFENLQSRIKEVEELYDREHSLFINTAISLAAAIDARDPYTRGHTERVTRYALTIARELRDLKEAKEYANFEETVHLASLLHDVGKIGVPDSILNKPARLSKEEYDKVKEHTQIGAKILSPIKELGVIADEIRAHHERFDGKGYPLGLKGEEIPFIARIIAVADTFDAITSDRPYRQRQMAETAISVIKEGSDAQFDSLVVSAFLLCYRKGYIKCEI